MFHLTIRRVLLLTVLTYTLQPVPAFSSPENAVTVLHFDDSGDQKVVAAVTSRGIVFIGSDLGVFRAFRSRALSQDDGPRQFFWLTDIDQDRRNEYVFGGSPSFVLDEGGNPLFGILDGCQDFFLDDMYDDDSFEVFCRNRSSMSVFFYDGQFIWEYSMRGLRIHSCQGDDLDGDGQMEVGCASSEEGTWILVDIGNDETVQEVPNNPTMVNAANPYEIWSAEAEDIFNGNQMFDVDGDGRAQEKLLLNDNALSILNSSGVTLGVYEHTGSELYSATVADLNDDGTPEIFLGGDGQIFVISSTGELVSTVNARPTSYERQGRVEVLSSSANGLEDSSPEATRESIDNGMRGIERCYLSRMGSDQFLRVGMMLYELSVNDSGRVSRTQRIHSSVQNEQIESCVEDALEDLRFSGATASSGSVTVRLGFDFIDE